MNGSIFQNCPRFVNFIQTEEKFWKSRWFCSKLGTKLVQLVYGSYFFSKKNGICMCLLEISWQHIRNKPKLEYRLPRYNSCKGTYLYRFIMTYLEITLLFESVIFIIWILFDHTRGILLPDHFQKILNNQCCSASLFFKLINFLIFFITQGVMQNSKLWQLIQKLLNY